VPFLAEELAAGALHRLGDEVADNAGCLTTAIGECQSCDGTRTFDFTIGHASDLKLTHRRRHQSEFCSYQIDDRAHLLNYAIAMIFVTPMSLLSIEAATGGPAHASIYDRLVETLIAPLLPFS
jgi:hypothetical protein